MNSFLKIVSFAIVLGVANAGAPAALAYSGGYASVLGSPVVAKSVAAAPVTYVSKSVGPALTYASAPVSYLSGAPSFLSGTSGSGYYSAGLAAAPLALLASAKPKVYSQSVPAAAVRNVETVMVTKTITPVVTKTTTHHTQAEPALSIGHVQGYSQGAVGHAKIAPVSFDTQYTTYLNPTVGLNGPVQYVAAAGPAVVKSAGVAAVAAVPAAVPQPVAYKTAAVAASPYAVSASPYAVAASPYAVAASPYAAYPGAALSLSSYGLDAYSVPSAQFLDVTSGKAVLTSGISGYAHKK